MQTNTLVTFTLFLFLHSFVWSQDAQWRFQIDSANVLSSPRCADLNQDGIKDIIFGAGLEGVASRNGVVAIDGKTGEKLWSVSARTQIYTSALFQDIDGDRVPDVFIGGRAASYYAISGATGDIIWEFWKGSSSESRKAGFLNFFGVQWAPDADNDGFNDLLVTNGGDYLATSKETSRPTARLMLISSKTGEIIQSVRMPEKRESYYAPHIVTDKKRSKVIFGTGGETIDGSLWSIPYKSLAKGKLKKTKHILQDTDKGFILNSVLTDLNEDGTMDVLNARMNAILTAVDGKSGQLLWEHQFPGKECYVTPSLGYFVGDTTPDFFTIIATGTFPQYTSFELIVIDGATGEIAWRNISGMNQFSPAASADLNNDGVDEIVYLENSLIDPKTYSMENRVKVIDLKNDTSYFIGPSRPGLSMASAPCLVDLDNNGTIELVVVTSSIPTEDKAQLSLVERINLDKKIETITWPGYLGPLENGVLPED